MVALSTRLCPPFEHKGTQHVGNIFLLQGEGDCVPCHEEGCDRHKQSDSRCLQELAAERVIAAALELLSEAQLTRVWEMAKSLIYYFLSKIQLKLTTNKKRP